MHDGSEDLETAFHIPVRAHVERCLGPHGLVEPFNDFAAQRDSVASAGAGGIKLEMTGDEVIKIRRLVPPVLFPGM